MNKHLLTENLKTILPPLQHLIDKKAEGVDWNESDPSASGYIANRPFYTETKNVDIIPLTTAYCEGGWTEMQIPLYELINNEIYTINFFDTEFHCRALEYSDGDYKWWLLGNLAIIDEGTDTGEPFFIYIENGYAEIIVPIEDYMEIPIQISGLSSTVHKIPEEYLPKIETIGIKGIGENAEVFNGGSADQASGFAAHAEGGSTIARNDFAHAEGYNTIASGQSSHTEGSCTRTGNQTIFDISLTNTAYAYGHAEGYSTLASGTAAHAEGQCSTASGRSSHAEGENTIASTTASHAEGYQCHVPATMGGTGAHAEGYFTKSYGNGSHSEGYYTEAKLTGSHAEGYYTVASAQYQHVQGKYNIDNSAGTYAHIVGNGTSNSARSNAHTLDWDGNAWFKGDVYVGGTQQSEGEKLVKMSELPEILNSNIINGSAAGSLRTVASYAESNIYSLGKYAFAEGFSTKASGYASHAEGSLSRAERDCAHAEGGNTTASGDYSHAEGYMTYATGKASHSEGRDARATGANSHAEGNYTAANGECSHAEGNYTNASGMFSHAQGDHTIAETMYQNVIGKYNVPDPTKHKLTTSQNTVYPLSSFLSCYILTGEPVFDENTGIFTFDTVTTATSSELSVGNLISNKGENISIYYRIESLDASSVTVTSFYSLTPGKQRGQYVHIVGNGTEFTRSNAHTLDWNGIGWFAGGLKVGGTGMDDEAAVEVATKNDITALGLPTPTTSDSGKFLRVNASGAFVLETVSNAEEASF